MHSLINISVFMLNCLNCGLVFHFFSLKTLVGSKPVFKTTLGVSRALGPGLTPNRKIGEYTGINRRFVFTLYFILCMQNTKIMCGLVVMLSLSALPLRLRLPSDSILLIFRFF